MPTMTEASDPVQDQLTMDHLEPGSQDSISDSPWSTEGNMEEQVDTNLDLDDLSGLPEYSPYSGSVHYTSPVPGPYNDQEGSDAFRDPYDHAAEPGVVGLQNLGNTCFMNAGLQCLFSNSGLACHFLEYFELSEHILLTLTGQYAALLKQVWSGKQSIIHPHKFKEVLGSYYPQFKDFRQHDCQEFMALLLDSFHEQLNENKNDGNLPEEYEEQNAGGLECCNSSLPNNILYKSEGKTLDTALPACPDVILNNSERSGKRRIPSDGDEVSSSSIFPSSSCTIRSGRRKREEPVASTSSARSLEGEGQSPEVGSPRETESQEAEVDSQSGVSYCLSEDSNLSESSTETVHSEDLRRRLLSIPMHLKSTRNEEGMEVEGESGPADSTSQTQIPVTGTKSMPCLEDFYRKDTKIQNTNVLVSDFENEVVTTDSSKFLKHDNIDRPTEVYENLSGFLLNEVKGGAAKAVKDTNLLSNMKEKFAGDDNFEKKCLWMEDTKTQKKKETEQEETDCSINNIKRIKIDEAEKNIRMQARLKMNTNKAIITEGRSSEPNIAMAETPWHHNIARVTNIQEHLQHRDVTAADKAWRRYLSQNKSVIVDNFQGQFKSTVVCAECSHVSVTYEPFMYLSVPLPHAMERQFGVIYIACDSRQPIRYLVTVQKQGSINHLKNKLKNLVGEDANSVVVAEVFHNHIARILDDNMLLRFINDNERTLYAFEMLPAPPVEEESTTPPSEGETSLVPNNCNVNNMPSPQNNDVFTNIGTFASEITNNQKAPLGESKDLEASQIVNNLGEVWSQSWMEGAGFVSEVDWSEQGVVDSTTGQMMGVDPPWEDPTNNETSTSQWEDPKEGTSSAEDGGDKSPQEEVTVDQWKSCAICLEEMADSELMTHTSCGGTLCQSCLDMSFKHYGDTSLICPVCSCPVDPAEDFIQLSAMADYQPKTRILCVPVLYRVDTCREDGSSMKLFGHPNLLFMSSCMTGESLFQGVDRVVPFLANYSILLTDGQGYHCSRCLYTTHCTGCEIVRESPEVMLQPGDHLAVRFFSINADQEEQADNFRDHVSMELKRSTDPLTLLDCFSAFTDSEVLDEHNPWHCPRCQRNRCAHKTITVWRYPNTLVVYLKRFVFHELSSTKIDCKVVCPLENLDLSDFISGPTQEKLTYDLQASICHTGGVNAGHYTSYAKHPQNGEWHYFNDETVSKKEPDEVDYSLAYVLFYQRQGTGVDLNLESLNQDEECDSASDSTNPQVSPCGKTHNQQLNEQINQLLVQLQGSQNAQVASSDVASSDVASSDVASSDVASSDVASTSSDVASTSSQTVSFGHQEKRADQEEPDSTLDFYT